MQEDVNFGELSKQAKARGFTLVFSQANLSCHIYFCLSTAKTRLIVINEICQISQNLTDFVSYNEPKNPNKPPESSLKIWAFLTWYYQQNLIGYDHFLLFNKLKLLDIRIFPEIALICGKTVP